jgi:CheY-like chemotaxis protein
MNTVENPFRILLIDDNPAIHDDFRKILLSDSSDDELDNFEAQVFGGAIAESSGPSPYIIESAYQGMEGFEMASRAKAEQNPYSLAFVDIRMPPGWDGVETVRNIWKQCPELQIVLCTAFSDYSWPQMHKILGSSDSLFILKKPFDNVAVLQLASALTRKWQMATELKNRMDMLEDRVELLIKELALARQEIAALRKS